MVVGPSATEMVRLIGGWLCDRVLAGWDVTVFAEQDANPRSLQILGVNSAELEQALADPLPLPLPNAFAVHADLYRCDLRARRIAADARDSSRNVALWGDPWVADTEQWSSPSEYRPSAAARAFKARALAANLLSVDEAEPAETFRWTGSSPHLQQRHDQAGTPTRSADSTLVRESR
jgi:hypothetical protein